MRDILAYTLCKGICDGRTIIVLDPKGELAAISRDQILGEGKAKKVITFNPRALHDLPQHRINPVGYLKWSSPTLIPDLKLLLENWFPKSGSANGEYFELNARRWAEAICLTLIKMHGVLELPHLYRVVNLLSGGGKEWIDFAYEMHTSGLQLSSDVEEEIAAMREDRSGVIGFALRDLGDDTALNKFSQIKLVAKLFVEGAHVFFRSVHSKTDMAQRLDRSLGESDVKAVLINHRGNSLGVGPSAIAWLASLRT